MLEGRARNGAVKPASAGHAPDSSRSPELTLGLSRRPFRLSCRVPLGSIRRLGLLEVGKQTGRLLFVNQLLRLLVQAEDREARATVALQHQSARK